MISQKLRDHAPLGMTMHFAPSKMLGTLKIQALETFHPERKRMIRRIVLWIRAPHVQRLAYKSPKTMQLTYLEAIRQGIWEEMEKDPTVFCLGEDIGIYGGAFKVTDGFIDRFGAERVIDTPIAESAIVGASFGAALTGMRPVAEFQFMDFIGCAMNQISNMVAKTHYLWGTPAPLVLRGPSGGG